jgi:hypothetical protein
MGKSTFDLVCKTCGKSKNGLGSKKEAERHSAAHAGGQHQVEIKERVPLSPTVRIGDRIKLKPDAVKEYQKACVAAGWTDVDLEAVRVVTHKDAHGTGARPRLFFEGRPFAFYPGDVVLAWNSDDERRKALGL